MINLPNQTKQWKQANNSDLYGNISVTKNINFDKEGYLRLSNSSRAAMHSVIDADFDVPATIIYNEDYGFFTATWDLPFSANERVLSAYPTQITTSGVPSTDIETDAVFFNDKMVVSQDTDVDYYDLATDTWTDTNITLTDDGQHPMCSLLSLNALAIANVNTIGLYANPISATPVLITTCTLNSTFEITSLAYLNQNLYIGTRNKYGGHAFMFVWNGQGSAAQQAYETDSNIIFSLCVHKSSIMALTGQGELVAFNGGGFTHLDAFPIFYTDRAVNNGASIGNYKNIMKSNGDVLYILFNNSQNTTNKLLGQPDGVWCYDSSVGLYHKYSMSNALVVITEPGTAGVNITTNEITVASPAVPTGTEVFYGEGTIGGLTVGTKYFTIKVDATHVKLATTKANALAGTPITLTTTGSAVNKFVFYPNIDFGATLATRTMALCVIDRPTTNSEYGTDLIWGGEVELRALTGDNGFMGTTSDKVENRGYFITPKVFSSEVTDNFNLLTVKFSPLTSELDKIIIKYRTVDDMRHEINLNSSAWQATWTSTNTFTTTQTDFSSAIVGDEVEFLKGAGGGTLAHITEIVNNSGTYTVTIDETFDNYATGDKAVFVFRNWKKITSIDWTNTLGYYSKQLGASGKFIQLKIELRGIGVQIEEVKVDNKFLLPAKA